MRGKFACVCKNGAMTVLLSLYIIWLRFDWIPTYMLQILQRVETTSAMHLMRLDFYRNIYIVYS